MPLNAFWFSKEIHENKLNEKRKLTLSFLILKCKIFWCHILTRGGKRLCFGFRAELVQVRMLWGYAIFITKILTLWSGVGYKGPGILNLSGLYRYADKNLLWTPFKRGPLVVTLRLKGWQSLIVWCPWCDVGRLRLHLARALSFSAPGSGRVTGLRLRHSQKLVQSNNKHTCGDMAQSIGPSK